MKKIIVAVVSILFLAMELHGQQREQGVGSSIWYRSEDIDKTPQQWQDSSGHGRHGENLFNGSLSTGLINTHKSYRFAGEGYFSAEYNCINTSRLTVIVVYYSKDTTEEHGLWSVRSGERQLTGQTDRRLLRERSEYVYPVKRRGIPLINTSMQSFSRIRNNKDSVYFILGASRLKDSSMLSYSGEIAECMVFDRILKKEESLKAESYLGIKYGITLIASDYLSSCGAKIWDYGQNEEYSHGIAGIGRDSVYGLYQESGSSTEEEDLLTVYLENPSSGKLSDNREIAQGSYWVWGHNEGSMSYDTLCEDEYPLLERKWLLQRSSTGSDSLLPMTLRIKIPREERDSNRILYLVTDRSGSGNFDSLDTEYTLMDSTDALGYIYYKDVVWDKDGSGRDVFSFSYGIELKTELSLSCPDSSTGGAYVSLCGGRSPYQYVLENDSMGKRWEYSGSEGHYFDSLPSGRYRIEITDSRGIKALDEFSIDAYPATMLSMPRYVWYSEGEELLLDAGEMSSGFVSGCLWEKDGIYYSKEKELNISQTGRYRLTITDSNGCKVSGETEVLEWDLSLDQDYNNGSNSGKQQSFPTVASPVYNLYPNPSTGAYTIEVDFPGVSAIEIRIFTANGVLLETRQEEGRFHYTLRGHIFTQGTYIVEIRSSYGKEQLKIIIRK